MNRFCRQETVPQVTCYLKRLDLCRQNDGSCAIDVPKRTTLMSFLVVLPPVLG